MDALLLARLQFALTTVYHFFFVPLTLGLSVLVALMQTLYVTSGQDVYKRMTKFWGKLLLVNFALGVVTGIVQEFQFGMNWSSYSRFVGDIFGAPLAIEALLAFFLESVFLGVWVFGWERVPKKMHLAAIWLVAIGSNLSALWILIANSFMQQPVGYVLRNGRAEMSDFFALVLNPNVWVQFPHVLFSGALTAGMFVLGISAYHLTRKTDPDLYRRSFQIASVTSVLAAVLVILNGHTQTQHMAQNQPMKLAAAEGLFETENPASFSLFTIGDERNGREVITLRLPRVLSLLAYNQLTGAVPGMNDLQAEYEAKYGPGDYVPPAWLLYWSFRAMVGAGTVMLGLAGFALFLSMGEMTERPGPRVMGLFTLAIALPYLANSTGWLLAEVGRFPWVVFGVMQLPEAVSPTVGVGYLWVSLIGYAAIYTALIAAEIYLMVKFARGPAARPEVAPAADGLPSVA
jgi:cytochrome d ubiquinol oxidase subunit I